MKQRCVVQLVYYEHVKHWLYTFLPPCCSKQVGEARRAFEQRLEVLRKHFAAALEKAEEVLPHPESAEEEAPIELSKARSGLELRSRRRTFPIQSRRTS